MSYATLRLNMVTPLTPYSVDPLKDTETASPGKSFPGHMWVSIERPGQPTQSFGFYPLQRDLFLPVGTPGVIGIQDNRNYGVPPNSYPFALDEAQFNAALEFCRTAKTSDAFGEWALFTHTCIDFAWAVVKQAGIPVASFLPATLWSPDGVLIPSANASLMSQTVTNYANSGFRYDLNAAEDRENVIANFSLGSEVVRGSAVANALSGGAGNDQIYGFGGSDVISGGSGTDTLYGGSGRDWLGYRAVRTGCEEELNSSGNRYIGGADDDHMFGSSSADTFIVRAGDGSDTIFGNGGADVLRYEGIGSLPTVSRNLKDLILVSGNTTQTFKDWYADAGKVSGRLGRVERTQTDGVGAAQVLGTVLGETLHAQGLTRTVVAGINELRGDLAHYEETLIGGSGNDRLYASLSSDGIQGGDVLDGGGGNDWLYGSIGRDRVRIRAGGGADTFLGQGGGDIIEVSGGLDFASFTTHYDRVAADMRMTFGDGTSLTVRNWDTDSQTMVLRQGEAGNAVMADWATQRVVGFYGDESGNVMTGNGLNNEIHGYGGNDTLNSGTGADRLYGGAGSDILRTPETRSRDPRGL